MARNVNWNRVARELGQCTEYQIKPCCIGTPLALLFAAEAETVFTVPLSLKLVAPQGKSDE
jgi:hypothetical protein